MAEETTLVLTLMLTLALKAVACAVWVHRGVRQSHAPGARGWRTALWTLLRLLGGAAVWALGLGLSLTVLEVGPHNAAAHYLLVYAPLRALQWWALAKAMPAKGAPALRPAWVAAGVALSFATDAPLWFTQMQWMARFCLGRCFG